MEDTLSARTQLIKVLTSAGLTVNNYQSFFHLPREDLYDLDFIRFHESSTTKALGIKWIHIPTLS